MKEILAEIGTFLFILILTFTLFVFFLDLRMLFLYALWAGVSLWFTFRFLSKKAVRSTLVAFSFSV